MVIALAAKKECTHLSTKQPMNATYFVTKHQHTPIYKPSWPCLYTSLCLTEKETSSLSSTIVDPSIILLVLFSCLPICAQAMTYKTGNFKIRHEDGARCLKGMWALYIQFFLFYWITSVLRTSCTVFMLLFIHVGNDLQAWTTR